MSAASLATHALRQRVQRRYRALLFGDLPTLLARPDLGHEEALDYLLHRCFPRYFLHPPSPKDPYQAYYLAEEKVQHRVPEIILRLPQPELERIAALLEAADLPGVITLVWYTYRPRLHKLDPPRDGADCLPSDESLHRDAGLGRGLVGLG